MGSKQVSIVVDLRTGKNIIHVPDLIPILSAAGYKPDVALKAYGGETLKLARKAAREGCGMVISYGGDGTLNDVVNGVMDTGGKSLIGDIPGGTFNEWAGVMGLPEDPVKAALALVESEARKVDLGHIEVQDLSLPGTVGQGLQTMSQGKKQSKQVPQSRQYFFLHVGLGADATFMAHISKPLKYRFGHLAFDLAAIEELPEVHPFPIEVQAMSDRGEGAMKWQGKAWQVIISKTRYYAGNVDLAPDAYLDDGLLNVCVITADGPIKTAEQALSFLVRRKLDEKMTKYFRGSQLSIRVPAATSMQVDGSIVKLEDYVCKAERDALRQVNDSGEVMVSYRFDVVPKAVRMAVPRTFNGTLFQTAAHNDHNQGSGAEQGDKQTSSVQRNDVQQEEFQDGNQQGSSLPQQQEYQLTVIGVAHHPAKPDSSIIAGRYKKQDTDESEVVAVRVNDRTLVLRQEDERVPHTEVHALQEGQEIVVEGEKSKRGVIRARGIKIAQE
jgi:YegS/Rv2252/BmrU family lipid kinase